MIDFSSDINGTPFANGRHVPADAFSGFVTVSTDLPKKPATIFNSNPAGPNSGTTARDLLVNLGNLLILQSPRDATQTIPGIFDTPIDATEGGKFFFDFAAPIELSSIDLVDFDEDNGGRVVLSDTGGRRRTYSVPISWTNDLTAAANGYAKLSLTTLADQVGETAAVATATQDAGFLADQVMRMEVELFGSGAIDNVAFVPEPTGISWMSLVVLMGYLARRRG